MRTRVLAGGMAAAAMGLASVAAGAPTSASPPSIKGYPGYNSVLTCQPGSWSADAKSFDYEWLYTSNGTVFAGGQTYRVESGRIGYDIACRVTAKDAGGDPASATSASVRTTAGRTKIVVSAKKVQHRKVTITGRVGPKAAVKGAQVVAYRVERDGLFQLFGKNTLKASGKFKIVAPDEPGKNRYKVNFNPAEPSLWQFSHATVKVRLKKH